MCQLFTIGPSPREESLKEKGKKNRREQKRKEEIPKRKETHTHAHTHTHTRKHTTAAKKNQNLFLKKTKHAPGNPSSSFLPGFTNCFYCFLFFLVVIKVHFI